MKRKGYYKAARDFAVITAASVLYAAGISLFLDPNNLAPGGVTGISVILNRLTGVPTGTLYFLINIPIILIGAWQFGMKFIVKTAYAVLLTSGFTNLLSGCGAVTSDPLLAAAAGAVLIAVGIGLIFKAGATTGGMDIIIKIIRRKYKHLKTGFLFQCTDLAIVTISGFLFRDINIALYAMLAVLISGRALDMVLYGGDEARMLIIVSQKPQEIGRVLMEQRRVGVTYLCGKGGWSGQEKQVILCVVPKKSVPGVEETVKEQDSAAFLIVTSANEIYGEGYKDFFEESL